MQYSSEAFLLAYVALLTIVAWLGVAIIYLMAASGHCGGRNVPTVVVNNFRSADVQEEDEDEESEDAPASSDAEAEDADKKDD